MKRFTKEPVMTWEFIMQIFGRKDYKIAQQFGVPNPFNIALTSRNPSIAFTLLLEDKEYLTDEQKIDLVRHITMLCEGNFKRLFKFKSIFKELNRDFRTKHKFSALQANYEGLLYGAVTNMSQIWELVQDKDYESDARQTFERFAGYDSDFREKAKSMAASFYDHLLVYRSGIDCSKERWGLVLNTASSIQHFIDLSGRYIHHEHKDAHSGIWKEFLTRDFSKGEQTDFAFELLDVTRVSSLEDKLCRFLEKNTKTYEAAKKLYEAIQEYRKNLVDHRAKAKALCIKHAATEQDLRYLLYIVRGNEEMYRRTTLKLATIYKS
jgi:hypothetical protein